jgi:hypothetical protein
MSSNVNTKPIRFGLIVGIVIAGASLPITASAADPQQSGGHRFNTAPSYNNLPTTSQEDHDKEVMRREEEASKANEKACNEAIGDRDQRPGLLAEAAEAATKACCEMKKKQSISSVGTELTCIKQHAFDWVASVTYECGHKYDAEIAQSLDSNNGGMSALICDPEPMLLTDELGYPDDIAGSPGWAIGVSYYCEALSALPTHQLDQAQHPEIDWSVLETNVPSMATVFGTASESVEALDCIPDPEGICTECDPNYPTVFSCGPE